MMCTAILWTLGAVLVMSFIVVLRRRGRSASLFLTMLGVNLALVVAALLRPGDDGGLVCFLSIAVGCSLLVVPALLAAAARAAVRGGRFGVASRLVALRQLLQPGLGAEREQQALASLALAHQGRIDEAISVSLNDLTRAGDNVALRLAILERLMTLYLFDGRPEQAVALFEREGGTTIAAVSPGVCAQAVRAYGELAAVTEIVRCQALLESSPAALDPAAAAVVNGSRLVFLAYLGRAREVDVLLDTAGFLPEVGSGRRLLWRAIAWARAGAAEHAASLWRRLEGPAGDPLVRLAAKRYQDRVALQPTEPQQLDDPSEQVVSLVTSRAMAYRAVPTTRGSMWRVAPVSAGLLVVIGAVYAVQWQLYQPTSAAWSLLRTGANMPLLSLGSQPWRFVTSIFLHGVPHHIHVIANAYALYLFGRLVEPLFGSWRFWLIFILSGIAGAVASAMWSHGLLSVGASGAISGLLGAAVVGVRGLRGRAPEGWRRQLMLNLGIVIALNMVIGLQVPVIDNAAHLGGLVAGLVVGALLGSRATRVTKRGERLVAGAGIMVGAVVIASGVLAVRADNASTLAAMPRHAVVVGGMRLRIPEHWVDAEVTRERVVLQDPLLEVPATMQVLLPQPALPNSGATDEASPAETARYQSQLIIERTKKTDGVRDVRLVGPSVRRLRAGLWAGRVRVLVGDRVIEQSHYFKLDHGVMYTIVTRVPGKVAPWYRGVLDEAAGSVSMQGERSG